MDFVVGQSMMVRSTSSVQSLCRPTRIQPVDHAFVQCARFDRERQYVDRVVFRGPNPSLSGLRPKRAARQCDPAGRHSSGPTARPYGQPVLALCRANPVHVRFRSGPGVPSYVDKGLDSPDGELQSSAEPPGGPGCVVLQNSAHWGLWQAPPDLRNTLRQRMSQTNRSTTATTALSAGTLDFEWSSVCT